MPVKTEYSHRRVRARTSLIAGILVGLTLVISGSGKVFAFGEMPGQTMLFIGSILPGAWLSPGLSYFLEDILLSIIIPLTELCLGIFLLLRIWPRFFATCTLPLTSAFIANNAWYISQGKNEFVSCECFGIWEEWFGTLTHVQALSLDIFLFALALTIVLVHPAGFFSSPPWSAKLRKGTKGKDKPGDPHHVKGN
jgi:uncharacterized membrane protein YphA (DoxX/SURF4 family)